MNKSKILSVALAAALVASVGAISASAATEVGNDGIKGAGKVGICGAYNGWGANSPDVAMTEVTPGVYEGTFTIDAVDESMFEDHKLDDELDGKKGIGFKVRLDDSWDNSWGDYEKENARTFNSQSDCLIEDKDITIGGPLTVKVTLDTTKTHPQAIADNAEDPDYGTADPCNFLFWPVTYEKVESTPATDTKTEDTKTEDTKTEDTKTEDTKTEDTKAKDTKTEDTTTDPADTTKDDTKETPATGDATSAAALVAVVLASLGAAVVMTKKASVKE